MSKKKKNNSAKLNILENRKLHPYTKIEYFGRFLWSIFFLFFRYSPRVFFAWRNFILRLFGAKIGKNVHIYPSAVIYLPWNLKVGNDSSIGEWTLIYNLGKIDIGSKATISHRAHLCAGTHQYFKANLPLMRLPIKIGDQAWICSDSFIGPNVIIGNNAIVGAGAVVMKNVKSRQIVAGNPAKFIKFRKINK